MIASNYAKALYELKTPKDDILETERILRNNPQLYEALENPAVAAESKRAVIRGIFPKSVQNFLCYLCDNGHICIIYDIVFEYQRYEDRMNRIIEAVIICVTPPSDEQLEKIKVFLCRKFDAADVKAVIQYDSSLLGGFIINACGMEFDRSVKGRLDALRDELNRR